MCDDAYCVQGGYVNVSIYRVGALPSLCGRPLVAHFGEQGSSSQVETMEGEVAQLAEMLEEGVLDAALLDIGTILKSPGRVVVADVSVSSVGKLRAVRLLSKVPLTQIRSLAVEMGLPTPCMLARLMLRTRFGIDPEIKAMLPSPATMLEHCDACIISGKLGFIYDAHGYLEWDVSEAWTEQTGMPFPWALWAGRSDLSEELAFLLRDARGWAESHIGETIRFAAHDIQDKTAEIAHYITQGIDFTFTRRHERAMSEFARLAVEHGLLDQAFVPQVLTPRAPASVWRKRE